MPSVTELIEENARLKERIAHLERGLKTSPTKVFSQIALSSDAEDAVCDLVFKGARDGRVEVSEKDLHTTVRKFHPRFGDSDIHRLFTEMYSEEWHILYHPSYTDRGSDYGEYTLRSRGE